MTFRKAAEEDIAAVSGIYAATHEAEECGKLTVGWMRGVYPTTETAKEALQRGDLFVGTDDGRIFGTAIINQRQLAEYGNGRWQYAAGEREIMVLHTLVIDPELAGRGYGKKFVEFYEAYAASHDCRYLRMDTQAINKSARALYQKLGYREIDVIPCSFNGIDAVQLVLLEKKLPARRLSSGSAGRGGGDMTEVVAALIWDGDRFMICQRPAHKARGLLWEFVGGKVEPGETREQALIRECREELAVTVSVGEVFMDVVHEYPDLLVHLTLFNAAIAEGVPQKLEHNDIRWITVDEIPSYDFCPADEGILKQLMAK